MPPRGARIRRRDGQDARPGAPAGAARRWRCAPGSWPPGRRLRPGASTSAGAASCRASRTPTSTSPPGRSGCTRRGSRERARATRRSAASRRRSRASPPGGWLRGLGWREGDWPEPPDREALDRVTGAVPAALMSKDYHSLWVNSAALEHADEPLEMPGGVVERDADGRPAGILRETAAWTFRDRYVRPTLRGDGRGLARGDADRRRTRRDRAPRQGRLARLVRGPPAPARGRRAARAGVAVAARGSDSTSSSALGVRSGFGNDMLRLGYLKGFMDGTLGSATALLLDGSGVEITSRDGARGRGSARRARGLAGGRPRDRRRREPGRARRLRGDPRRVAARAACGPRIEHAQLLAPEEFARFAEIGVTASVQFSHAPSDRDLADRLWEGRQGAYAYRSLADAGARLANGSDAPVEELDPLAGIVAGVRRTLDERPPWRPEQALTLDEALRATCVAPAWLERQEQRRGMLRPGMLADLVVLDRDPYECPPEELGELSVVATMVGGRWTHVDGDWDPGVSATPDARATRRAPRRRDLRDDRRGGAARRHRARRRPRGVAHSALGGGHGGRVLASALLVALDSAPRDRPRRRAPWLPPLARPSLADRPGGVPADRGDVRGGRPRRDRRDGDPDLGLVVRRPALRVGRRGRAPGAGVAGAASS